MTERPLPYIGISGVNESAPAAANTQHWLLEQFSRTGLDSDNNPHRRQITLGVKAVHKTQYLDIANKYGREWYPVGDEFATALDDDIKALRVAQLYLDPGCVTDSEYRREFIDRICRRGRSWLTALQFDMLPWHEDNAMLPFIEETRERTGLSIILQAHGETMEQLGPTGVARRLGRYGHALNFILLDASHGKGVRMDPSALLPFLDAGYSSQDLSAVGFGVAGGLCADVVREDLPALLEAHHDISWDAEGRLHSDYKNGSGGLDWTATKHYLEASSDVLNALPQRPV